MLYDTIICLAHFSSNSCFRYYVNTFILGKEREDKWSYMGWCEYGSLDSCWRFKWRKDVCASVSMVGHTENFLQQEKIQCAAQTWYQPDETIQNELLYQLLQEVSHWNIFSLHFNVILLTADILDIKFSRYMHSIDLNIFFLHLKCRCFH